MFDALTELAGSSDQFISFFPSATPDGSRRELSRLGIRILHGDLEQHLRQPGTTYDVIVISRPHNYERFGSLVRAAQPHAVVVYDAEALYYRRTQLQADLAVDPSAKSLLRAEAVQGRLDEEGYFADADCAVCISEDEAAIARAVEGVGEVHVIPAQLVGPQSTSLGFEERRDIIFVASWLAGADSPNGDGFRWFVDNVLPLIRDRLPWARIRVTGGSPPEVILRYESPNVHFEGRVSDLGEFYNHSRVAIAPIRYGAGVKIKTIEALQYGIPTVATTVGAEGIDTHGTGALCIEDDPRQFADRVVRLADDPLAWSEQRHRIKTLHAAWSEHAAGTTWQAVVDQALRVGAAGVRGG
jgi:glycosyltransferase involved in cell wall biosynthesis